jgi:uncharacterized membrane protein YphA (DoxX/SURF4 family)
VGIGIYAFLLLMNKLLDIMYLMKFLRWSFRIILGLVFIASAVGKLIYIPGFVKIIETYKLYLPPTLTWTLAIGVSVIELIIGVWILFGKNIKTAVIISIILNSGYFILVTLSLIRGLQIPNCGCFGIFLARPLVWYTPLEDLFLIMISLGLYTLETKRELFFKPVSSL